MTPPPCFGIAGWKNSGKTSLVAGLISEMTKRGLKVSALKHAHHAFDLDTPGTDSFKHREAGAMEVILVSQNRWAIQHELQGDEEPTFEEVVGKLSPCDLVLVEGYKREPIPKLEIVGPITPDEYLWKSDTNVRAIACDWPLENCSLPQFQRREIPVIADFILEILEISE
ncbi:MAG: molybdopterin-guanine dinucleotide biosynthesis protein B [Pseudomonadota bacterium]